MKKLIFLCVILLPLFLFAQQNMENANQESSNGFSMGGAIGSVTFGNVTYSEIHITPEINLGKIGIGLDFDILIDKYGGIRQEDWDDPKDILTKIYMIRYAQRNDPYYARVGGFPDYTLAHGLIMNHYSNMLRYPELRQIGAMFGANTPFSGLGIEVFSSNVLRNEVLAARAHIKPLSKVGKGLLKNLNIGASVVTDRNQYGGLADVTFDTDADGTPDKVDIDADNDGLLDASPYVLNQYPILQEIEEDLDEFYPDYDQILKSRKESVTEYSIDYDLPLIPGEKFYLSHYAEAAQIQDYNMGFIFPGFYSKFSVFELNAEFRNYQSKFIPGYFDQLYDQQRASTYYSIIAPDSELYAIRTKKDLIPLAQASMGWFASATSKIGNLVYLTISYQDMYSDSHTGGKSLWGNVRINPKFVPKIREASISYSQVNVDEIKRVRSNNAILEGRATYELSVNTNLIGRYTERYIDRNNDGKITDKNEILKTFGTSVEFRF